MFCKANDMKTKYELSAEQLSVFISWKEKHLNICKQKNGSNYFVAFDDYFPNHFWGICKDCETFKHLFTLDDEIRPAHNDKREFHEVIFMGMGQYSGLLIDKLHNRLTFAIHQLGGEQQNGGMGTEYDRQSAAKATQAIDDVILDIIYALGAQDRFIKK